MSEFKGTPHNSAKLGEIAETVLLPGDPLRAKFVAENFLENAVCYNTVRGMLGYTGYYKGHKVSVHGTGMGMPSIGIVAYELINFYGVKNLIRIGSAGGMRPDVNVRDIILAMGASTNSNFASQYNLPGTFSATASYKLLSAAVDAAKENDIKVRVENIVSSDVFYSDDRTVIERWAKMGIVATEMEAAALYMTAARAGVNALCVATISDNIVTGEELSAEARQNSFTDMMKVALEASINIDNK